jgi:hypothetical protein
MQLVLDSPVAAHSGQCLSRRKLAARADVVPVFGRGHALDRSDGFHVNQRRESRPSLGTRPSAWGTDAGGDLASQSELPPEHLHNEAAGMLGNDHLANALLHLGRAAMARGCRQRCAVGAQHVGARDLVALTSHAVSAAFQSPASTRLLHQARRSSARRVERATFARPSAPSRRCTTSRSQRSSSVSQSLVRPLRVELSARDLGQVARRSDVLVLLLQPPQDAAHREECVPGLSACASKTSTALCSRRSPMSCARPSVREDSRADTTGRRLPRSSPRGGTSSCATTTSAGPTRSSSSPTSTCIASASRSRRRSPVGERNSRCALRSHEARG